MFTRKELQIIRKATADKKYLESADAQKAWDKGAEDALEQSEE